MSSNTNEYMERLLKNIDLIRPEDIPGIDLYMDQVTTFMENHLGKLKRSEEDKILTKTMINNYAKNDLLPAPNKKKYSKDHVLMLTFIYYFKSFLTIGDIKTLTLTLTERYFNGKGDRKLADVYSELLNRFPKLFEDFKKDIANTEILADGCFDGAVAEDEYLRKFFFIALLGIDVYMKKQLIESMIDEMAAEQSAKAAKKAEDTGKTQKNGSKS